MMGNLYSSGVTNNGATTGTITFVVPYDAASTLYYRCGATLEWAEPYQSKI